MGAPTFQSWSSHLLTQLSQWTGSSLQDYVTSPLRSGAPTHVEDATLKILIKTRTGRPYAVALCSPPTAPEIVARDTRVARQARNALGEELGSAVIRPIGEGELEGLSYTICPYLRPFGDGIGARLEKVRVCMKVIRWLRRATERTCTEDATAPDAFRRCLCHVEERAQMPAQVRRSAGAAIERIDQGVWTPRFVLMHGDLWPANILRSTRWVGSWLLPRSQGFALIDWSMGQVAGFAMYDLIRLSRTLRLPLWYFRREVTEHCRILDCSPLEAEGYLLAALGYVGLNLGCFPVERYLDMCESCVEFLGRVTETRSAS